MFRFVILYHARGEPSDSHFDWLFEVDAAGPLTTWACDQPVSGAVASELPCRELASHRRAYLDYEGAISGGRGVVSRWDHGFYQLISADSSSFRVRLSGHRLQGIAEFVGSHGAWRLVWSPEAIGPSDRDHA